MVSMEEMAHLLTAKLPANERNQRSLPDSRARGASKAHPRGRAGGRVRLPHGAVGVSRVKVACAQKTQGRREAFHTGFLRERPRGAGAWRGAHLRPGGPRWLREVPARAALQGGQESAGQA